MRRRRAGGSKIRGKFCANKKGEKRCWRKPEAREKCIINRQESLLEKRIGSSESDGYQGKRNLWRETSQPKKEGENMTEGSSGETIATNRVQDDKKTEKVQICAAYEEQNQKKSLERKCKNYTGQYGKKG